MSWTGYIPGSLLREAFDTDVPETIVPPVVDYGPTYPKINTLWKRDAKNRVIVGDFARPEFEELAFSEFIWTEKIDGTNTRFYWNGKTVAIGGRTDNAVWNPRVLDALMSIAQPSAFREVYGDTHVVLYGETFGPGIQKGGGYGDRVMFRPFDLRMGTEKGISQNSPFTGRAKMYIIADALGVEPVAVLGSMSIGAMWGRMSRREVEGTYSGVTLEGVVGRPATPFYIANQTSLSPVLVKMKYRDLDDLERRR